MDLMALYLLEFLQGFVCPGAGINLTPERYICPLGRWFQGTLCFLRAEEINYS
jgi:hypothetical protein